MKSAARFVATFAAGFLVAVLLQHILRQNRLIERSTAPMPSLVVTQYRAYGPIIVATQAINGSLVTITQVHLQSLHTRPGLVRDGFLFDGVRPQDLQRMNPPRNHPSFAPPHPNLPVAPQ